MTYREVDRSEVLESLGEGGDDPILRTSIAALRLYARPRYTIGGTPANVLRQGLEVKYRRAMSRGKDLVGDTELLLRLHDLGSEPVSVVSATHGVAHYFVYVYPLTLKPVGAVIMYDSPEVI
ncbi:hypothetical protein AB0F91_44450 [Amycolatopsis sp. NPDC023774]|uniref:hypothetical protein n=1 Tax=Amycolatopsis sp. NPDC023774 TaxID=3155015 RepID=UPI0033F73CE9